MPKKTAINLTNLWRDFGPNTYPIDMCELVNGVVNKMGSEDRLVLKYEDFESFDGLMMPINGTKNWVALVNSSIPNDGRKNFTAAHEIYHFLGHRKLHEKFECTRGDISNSKKALEQEANDFASQLILPPDKIRPKTDECFNYENVKSLADTLGASVSAVAYKWIALSAKPLAFVVSRDGFISHGFPSPSAKKRRVFIKRESEIPLTSKTAQCDKEGCNGIGEVDAGVWHRSLGAEEWVFIGNDGYTYTFLEFKD